MEKIKEMNDNDQGEIQNEQVMNLMKTMFTNMASMPGIDEIMNFLHVVKIATDKSYEVVIFDTAPTGHTLRFLEIPSLAIKFGGMIESMRGTLMPIM